jgi:hypothetical protein
MPYWVSVALCDRVPSVCSVISHSRELRDPSFELFEGLRQLLPAGLVRRGIELPLQLDARELARLELPRLLGIALQLAAASPLLGFLELVHALLDPRVSVD